jgi:anti-anti-sigma factor
MAESRFELDRLLRDWGQSGVRCVILHCRDLEYIDSAGLATMIGGRQQMRRVGGDLILSEMNPALSSLFDRTSMNAYFKIFADLPEARTHLRALIADQRKKGRGAEAKVQAPESAPARAVHKPRRAVAKGGAAKKKTSPGKKKKAAAKAKTGGRKAARGRVASPVAKRPRKKTAAEKKTTVARKKKTSAKGRRAR